jgi:hypothetical protein
MKKVTFGWLAGPLLCLMILAFFIGIERAGVRYEYQLTRMAWLPSDFSAEKEAEEAAESVILYDSGWSESIDYKNAISFVLSSMRIPHDITDAAKDDFPDLTRYKTLVIAFNNLDIISSSIFDLNDWVESGGRVLFAVIPDITTTMNMIYPKLGIQYGKFMYNSETPLVFKTNLLPGAKDMEFGSEAMCGSSVALRVTDSCTVHIATCDEKQVPLLWECSYGKGKFVVNNNDLMKEKNSRGIVCAAYSLLEDICVYPVMNFSLFFIDDFPAPIPEGTHDVIYKHYGRNIENFYKNIWWPDMLLFSKKYGLRYTGMLVETYNDNVTGPFTADHDLESFRYFGGMLMKYGGEIGLHGYNHMPLCLESFNYKGIYDYNKWPEAEQMAQSVNELIRFGTELFPENEFVTYVPPSNILSNEGREMITERFPQIKVISCYYYVHDLDSNEEFSVSDGGVINLPRTVSGYELTPYMRWCLVNELGFHYTNSHFLHPDDVLDDERGAQKGWRYLRDQFEKQIVWLDRNAPGLRKLTAKQGGAALERYDKLSVHKQVHENRITLTLSGFYDEAWLMLRLNTGKLNGVEGAGITNICDNLYLIHAKQPVVTIFTKEE